VGNPILAYAFLKATYGEHVRNPVDAVMPIVKRALFNYGKNSIDSNKLQKKVAGSWGLEIPMNVIRYMLPKLWRLGILARDEKTHLYTLSDPEYRDQAIVEAERIARETYGEVVGQLTSTCSDLGVKLTGDEVLEGWLDRSSLSFLGGSTAAAYRPPSARDRIINRVIAKAMSQYGYSSELQKSLTEIALGDALYRAVQSLTEFNLEDIDAIDLTQRMDKVSCYFDTALILKVLGYLDEEQTSAAQELLSMCKATGCRLSVFSHTIDEIQRIFRAASLNLYHQQRSAAIRGDLASYALEHGLSENELIELGASVPDALTKLGFQIEDPPTITIPLSVDEAALEKSLQAEMNKQTTGARITDVNSLTAIYRLRHGLPKRYLEKCEAIFVTTNKAMADIATRFFQNHFKEEGQNNIVQLCMTDIIFSVRLWPKLPTPAKSLPKNQIISYALSNLIPSNKMLDSFFRIIRQLSERGKMTEDAEIAIRLSRFTEQTLVLELDENVRDLSEKQAVSIANKIIGKQRDLLSQIRENEKTNVRHETQSQIEQLVNELEKLQHDYELKSENLSDMVKKIENQDASIKNYESIFNKIERRVSVLADLVLNIIVIIIVAWFINYCFSFFGGTSWWFIDKMVIGLLTLMTWFGLSRLSLRSALALWMTRLVLRLIMT
jgi:hypothetical protein